MTPYRSRSMSERFGMRRNAVGEVIGAVIAAVWDHDTVIHRDHETLRSMAAHVQEVTDVVVALVQGDTRKAQRLFREGR